MSEAAHGTQSPSSSASEPAPSPPAGAQTPSSTNPAAGAPKGYVPNAALQAERRQRQQASSAAQQAQAQVQQLQADVAALKVSRETSPEPATDPYRQNLISTLGNDEAGEAALKMFDAHGEMIRAEMASQIPKAQDIRRMVSEQATKIVDQRVGQHSEQERAIMSVAQRLHGWIEKGSLSPVQAVEMRQKFDAIAAESPHVLSAVNSHAVMSNLFTEAMDAGEVTAFSPQAPRPPQVGVTPGSGPAPAPLELPEVSNPSTHIMQSMRGVTPEALRRIREQSVARHAAAQGS